MHCANMADGGVSRTNAVRYQLETGVWDVSMIHRGKAGCGNSWEPVKGKRGPHPGRAVLSPGLGPGCSLQGLVCCRKGENRGAAEGAVVTLSWARQLDGAWWYQGMSRPSWSKVLGCRVLWERLHRGRRDSGQRWRQNFWWC